MSPQEIISKAKRAAELKKNYEDKSKVNKFTPLPEYYPSYPLAADYCERIKIHSEVGYFPEKLFTNRAPNQTDKEAEYLKKNYKNITLPVFMDYISTITRGWSDSNWSIKYQQDENIFSEYPLQKYIENEIKDYGSIENFVKFILPSIKSCDANGVIAIRPHSIPFIKDEEGNIILKDKQPEVDETQLYEPIPFYYSSKQITDYKVDEYYLIELEEKSLVEWGNTKRQMGMIYEFYDRDNIYIITQVGKYLDFKFEIKLYFNHNWNRVPVTKLKGIPKIIGKEILWLSPFLFSCDILDMVALNNSYLQAVIASCTFPYRVMVGDLCEFEDKDGNKCFDGFIVNDSGKHLCSQCQGTGLKNRISPLGVMLLRPKTRENDGDSTFSNKPMEYISPGIETQNFLEEKISRDTEKARAILHLKTSNSIIKGTENLTATGMGLDMQALYAFVKTISDQSFEIFEFIIDAIGYMRYSEGYKKPSIIYPNSFDFKTETDYFIEIQNSIKSGLPPFVIHTIVLRYLQSVYYNEQSTVAVFNLIVNTDRLITFANDDVSMMVAGGTAAKWEKILHDSSLVFVNELLQESEKFFEQDFNLQKEQLIKKAQEKANEISGKQINAAETIIAASGGASDDDRLGKIPLAIQQLALARVRAEESGDKKLSALLGKKIDNLLEKLE